MKPLLQTGLCLWLTLAGIPVSRAVDAPLVEPVFLAPGQRRAVHFYPYVSEWSNWRLSVGSGPSIEISQPRPSRRGARILLESSDVLGDTRGSVRRFPENQFPPFVTATDTLQAVLLDHVPNWDEARRTAFLDWLYSGGAVFVLHTAGGRFPELDVPVAPARVFRFEVMRRREEQGSERRWSEGFRVVEAKIVLLEPAT